MVAIIFFTVNIYATFGWWSNRIIYIDQVHVQTGHKEFETDYTFITNSKTSMFRDRPIFGGDFTHSCMHRVTLCNGAWRERWSNSKDQQEEPVGRLNEFQHKKNTPKKGLFVSLNCFLESLSLHNTFCATVALLFRVIKVTQWAIKLIQLIKAITQQLKGSAYAVSKCLYYILYLYYCLLIKK